MKVTDLRMSSKNEWVAGDLVSKTNKMENYILYLCFARGPVSFPVGAVVESQECEDGRNYINVNKKALKAELKKITK